MWKDKLYETANNNQLMKIGSRATDRDISLLSDKLGEIPKCLEQLLREINGDSFVLLSVSQIIDTNINLRALQDFMPLDCLLFFAGNGCGDYYGFQIRKSGAVTSNIYMWDHETDNRTWIAEKLDDFLQKYCDGDL